jgi:hypothetical protein
MLVLTLRKVNLETRSTPNLSDNKELNKLKSEGSRTL